MALPISAAVRGRGLGGNRNRGRGRDELRETAQVNIHATRGSGIGCVSAGSGGGAVAAAADQGGAGRVERKALRGEGVVIGWCCSWLIWELGAVVEKGERTQHEKSARRK